MRINKSDTFIKNYGHKKTPDHFKRSREKDTEAGVYKSEAFMPAEVNKSDTFILLRCAIRMQSTNLF